MTSDSQSPPPADPAAGSASDPGALAADLRALVGQLKRRMMAQSGDWEMTPSQTAVLLRLDRDGPATVSALSRAEGVRPQSMRTTVAALEALGHVAGRPDPADGRQTIIFLTDSFRAWLAEGRSQRQDWLSRRLANRLTAEERARLAAAADLLRRIAED